MCKCLMAGESRAREREKTEHEIILRFSLLDLGKIPICMAWYLVEGDLPER